MFDALDFMLGMSTGAATLSIINQLLEKRRLSKFRRELARIILEDHEDFHRTDYNSPERQIDAARECRAEYYKLAKGVLESGKGKE